MSAPESSKRAFVLVHGAWHGGWCWAKVARTLQDSGHRVFAPSLTGLAERAHLFGAQVTLATHVEDVVRLIEWEAGEGCVLVGHSYAGIVLTGVADRLRDRVGRYVFLDAAVPPDGVRNWRWADFSSEADRQRRLLSIAGAGAGVALPAPPAEAFGITDPALREWAGSRFTAMPAGTYLEPIRLENGGSQGLDRVFVAAVDPVYPPLRSTHERLRGDPGWQWREVGGGHDAMLTAPAALAQLLLELAA